MSSRNSTLSLLLLLTIALAGCGDDAGSDAGAAIDAGSSMDAGGSTDAGGGTDAGSSTDAGGSADAGDATDAATTSDAGPASDGGGLTDGGGGVRTPCGATTCDRATEVCFECACGGPTSFTCMALPSSCAGTRNCACLGSMLCTTGLAMCTDRSDNHIFCDTGLD